MINRYAKVKGYPNLLRDLDTNAIINVDSFESNNYDRARSLNRRRKEEIDIIKSDIKNIKTSLDEIKNLLREFVNES